MRKAEIKFLNVDLEIESAEDLGPIIDDLGDDVSVMYHGANAKEFNLAVLETIWEDRDIDGVIAEFCRLLENLSPAAKTVWDGCRAKRFDAGFESGDAPASFQTELRRETIERIAALGASLVVTIYPPGD